MPTTDFAFRYVSFFILNDVRYTFYWCHSYYLHGNGYIQPLHFTQRDEPHLCHVDGDVLYCKTRSGSYRKAQLQMRDGVLMLDQLSMEILMPGSHHRDRAGQVVIHGNRPQYIDDNRNEIPPDVLAVYMEARIMHTLYDTGPGEPLPYYFYDRPQTVWPESCLYNINDIHARPRPNLPSIDSQPEPKRPQFDRRSIARTYLELLPRDIITYYIEPMASRVAVAFTLDQLPHIIWETRDVGGVPRYELQGVCGTHPIIGMNPSNIPRWYFRTNGFEKTTLYYDEDESCWILPTQPPHIITSNGNPRRGHGQPWHRSRIIRQQQARGSEWVPYPRDAAHVQIHNGHVYVLRYDGSIYPMEYPYAGEYYEKYIWPSTYWES